MHNRFERAIAQMPLFAVLRGLTPQEAEAVGDALVEAGFLIIEVPLNSPDPFLSIARLVQHCPPEAVIGAGTVLRAADVDRLHEIGATLVVSPNIDPEVVSRALALGMVPVPGCLTPSEVLSAVAHGATTLKIFPAARLGATYLKDLRAVLPPGIRLVPLGGVSRANMAEFHAMGADGFGFGTNLYTPGRTAAEVGRTARELVGEYRRLASA